VTAPPLAAGPRRAFLSGRLGRPSSQIDDFVRKSRETGGHQQPGIIALPVRGGFLSTNRFTMAVAVLAIIWTTSGCGGNDHPSIHISGTATFDGQPIPFGQILFEPDASAGNSGPAGFATITDGKFDTRSSGKGITRRGRFVVTIHGQTRDPAQGNDTILPLFNPYEVQAEIAHPVKDFDVPASAAKNLVIGPPV
jgi:hypothetical protein